MIGIRRTLARCCHVGNVVCRGMPPKTAIINGIMMGLWWDYNGGPEFLQEDSWDDKDKKDDWNTEDKGNSCLAGFRCESNPGFCIKVVAEWMCAPPVHYMFHLISTLRHFSHVWCNCWEIDIELWVRIKRKIENKCNVDLSGHGWYFNMVIKQWEIVIRHHFLSLSFSDNYVYSCWPIFLHFGTHFQPSANCGDMWRPLFP